MVALPSVLNEKVTGSDLLSGFLGEPNPMRLGESKSAGTSDLQSAQRQRWGHFHHRHRPHIHVPHIHVPHLHTAKMIKDTKDAAAKAAKDAKDAAAKAAKDAADLAAKTAKDAADLAAKTARDAAAALAREATNLGNQIGNLAESSIDELQKLGDEAIRLAEKGILKPLQDLAEKLLRNLLKPVKWDAAKYHSYMTKVASDFTEANLNTVAEYSDFNNRAASSVKELAAKAYRSMPLQTQCQISLDNHNARSSWHEWNPTPIKEIPVFNTFPFSEQNKESWLVEPCNAVSNGAFLKLFRHDTVINDLKLQYAAFGMCWGSWYFHGDGGVHPLGGSLDVWSIDVMFYYMYKEGVDKLIHDADLRKEWADPTGGMYGVSDHKAEVDNFVRVMGMSYAERNVYTVENYTNITSGELYGKNQSKAHHIMAKMPSYGHSIAGFVMVIVRSIFHKGVPLADEIYKFITDLLIDALIQCESACSCESRAFVKKRRDGLDKDKIKGFDDPTRGGAAMLNIFADFLEAMFWQESGKFGPGTKTLISHVPVDGGCTWMPHSAWHRKAERVVGGFLDAVYNHIETGTSHSPSTLSTLKNVVGGIHRVVDALVKVYNMKRANGLKPPPTNPTPPSQPSPSSCGEQATESDVQLESGPRGDGLTGIINSGPWDFVDTKGLLAEVRKKFGNGWAPQGRGDGNANRMSNTCISHSHSPRNHSPHSHSPHSHSPHSHSPHSHSPHSHSPHSHHSHHNHHSHHRHHRHHRHHSHSPHSHTPHRHHNHNPHRHDTSRRRRRRRGWGRRR